MVMVSGHYNVTENYIVVSDHCLSKMVFKCMDGFCFEIEMVNT